MSLDELKARLSELNNVNRAAAILGWDQQTMMPPGGAEARARQLGTLSKIAHEIQTADETGRLIEDAKKEVAGMDYESDDAALVRAAEYDYEQATKLPTDLVVAITETTTLAHEVWVEARANNDFEHFRPMLEKIFDLTHQMVECFGYKEVPYDALLDQYERGMPTREVKRLFDELKQELVPLVKAIAENQDAVDDSVLHRSYPIDKQREFGEKVVSAYGFDFKRGRQDLAVHPFCTHFSANDVRITTRFDPNWINPALFGTMHESGHGMYEQGVAQNLDNSILGSGTSLGVHESQSRMWENIVGRSRGFWGHFYPELQALFPDALNGVTVDTFYKAINKSYPSFIRVEADEVTYNLHIMVRFELEQAIMNGELAIKDLPAAWNAKFEDYLGIVPPNDAQGVLQDVHWSSGLIGYFPTYSLGNLLSVQFYDKAVQEHPEIPNEIARGKFDTLLNWLRVNIHQHGRKFTPQELVQHVTGTSIQTGPFMRYLTEKYTDIYNL